MRTSNSSRTPNLNEGRHLKFQRILREHAFNNRQLKKSYATFHHILQLICDIVTQHFACFPFRRLTGLACPQRHQDQVSWPIGLLVAYANTTTRMFHNTSFPKTSIGKRRNCFYHHALLSASTPGTLKIVMIDLCWSQQSCNLIRQPDRASKQHCTCA